MRVLVTGAAGFVGRAVVERLATRGHEVVALVRRPVQGVPLAAARTLVADLLDGERLGTAVAEARPEGVCHLAALTRVRESFLEPLRYFAVNVHGTVGLLEALRGVADGGVGAPRLVFASTASVYGPHARQPIAEDQPPAPTNPYGASKLAADQVIGYHAATGAIGAVSLRCFNVAGALGSARDRDQTRLIPAALAAAAGETPALAVNGDGTVVREYVHVADLAEAYVLALEAAEPGTHRILNAGSGTGTSVNEVIAAVEEVTGRPVPIERRPAQDEPHVLMADSTRIRAELSWRPQRSSIREIVEDGWRALRAG
jgi:UDP-glucose 4-epimerase